MTVTPSCMCSRVLYIQSLCCRHRLRVPLLSFSCCICFRFSQTFGACPASRRRRPEFLIGRAGEDPSGTPRLVLSPPCDSAFPRVPVSDLENPLPGTNPCGLERSRGKLGPIERGEAVPPLNWPAWPTTLWGASGMTVWPNGAPVLPELGHLLPVEPICPACEYGPANWFAPLPGRASCCAAICCVAIC